MRAYDFPEREYYLDVTERPDNFTELLNELGLINSVAKNCDDKGNYLDSYTSVRLEWFFVKDDVLYPVGESKWDEEVF